MHIEQTRHDVYHLCGLSTTTAVLARPSADVPLDTQHVLAALHIVAANSFRGRVITNPSFSESERASAKAFLDSSFRSDPDALRDVLKGMIQDSTYKTLEPINIEDRSLILSKAQDRALAIDQLITRLDEGSAPQILPSLIQALQHGTRALKQRIFEPEVAATARAASALVVAMKDFIRIEIPEAKEAMKLIGDLLCCTEDKISSSIAIALTNPDIHDDRTVTMIMNELTSRVGLRSKETLRENPYIGILSKRWPNAISENASWKALPERAFLVTMANAFFGSRRIWGNQPPPHA